ncbi:DUF3168 domain-containing protein [Limibaculum sp. FT325]|uniref:tail completion protein gp17 n=1 Tax=Thermohalobaculum sediminis TaxID=2939436 RepID=UPI0020C16154|nr:DUF3168 domain-containing protein [Limibaculum sediminis]MCL5775588.1 DUF3168 domain-containing protein [Limibaculum sediminis]
MTYALAWPLQKAVYERLAADPAVAAATGGRIHDGAPQERTPGAEEGIYLILGDDQASDWSSAERAGAGHLVGVSVVAPPGAALAKPRRWRGRSATRCWVRRWRSSAGGRCW